MENTEEVKTEKGQPARRPKEKDGGGFQKVFCVRCGEQIHYQEDFDLLQPDGARQHHLERCFELIKAKLDALQPVTAKEKEEEPEPEEEEEEEEKKDKPDKPKISKKRKKK
jgi:hypothetical protein